MRSRLRLGYGFYEARWEDPGCALYHCSSSLEVLPSLAVTCTALCYTSVSSIRLLGRTESTKEVQSNQLAALA